MTATHLWSAKWRVSLLGLSFLGLLAAPVQAGDERLTSRPKPAPPVVKLTAVGAEVRTGSGQRRRLVLSEGSLLYVNEQTSLKITAARRLKLTAGEILVETAAPRKGDGAFVVETPGAQCRRWARPSPFASARTAPASSSLAAP